MFYSSLRVSNNHATTQLLWRDPSDKPTSNFIEAYDLFPRCKEFYRSSDILQAIQSIIDEWKLVGYIFEVDLAEARSQLDSFYIPTFVVSRVDKLTTKHRLVFNAARQI